MDRTRADTMGRKNGERRRKKDIHGNFKVGGFVRQDENNKVRGKA